MEQAKRVLTAKWSRQGAVSFIEEAYRVQDHPDIPASPEFELFLKMRADQSLGLEVVDFSQQDHRKMAVGRGLL